MIYNLKNLLEYCESTSTLINNKWVPARPKTILSYRIKAAWLCLTGKADAVKWPEGQ